MNSFAWVPSRLRYNGFGELKQAASVLKQSWEGPLELGKADFQSAFKTIPTAESQAWLCWALVYNPELKRHQIARLNTQTFGSLGAVVAWYRTARAIQTVMTELGLVILAYVDDCFWVTPKFDSADMPDATWFLRTFEFVTDYLLGWKLDPAKSAVGTCITLLGLEIDMQEDVSNWRLSPDKAEQWCKTIEGFLEADVLLPSEASKLAGRLCFMNSQIYSRLGRALLRPIIWRQIQQHGGYTLTRRLRWSLIWFYTALKANWTRRVPYQPPTPDDQLMLYTDAESTGCIAAVLIHKSGRWYMSGVLPQGIRQLLKPRRTNIVGYELLAAILGVIMVDVLLPKQMCVRYIPTYGSSSVNID